METNQSINVKARKDNVIIKLEYKARAVIEDTKELYIDGASQMKPEVVSVGECIDDIAIGDIVYINPHAQPIMIDVPNNEFTQSKALDNILSRSAEEQIDAYETIVEYRLYNNLDIIAIETL